jgi:hypothetical protein
MGIVSLKGVKVLSTSVFQRSLMILINCSSFVQVFLERQFRSRYAKSVSVSGTSLLNKTHHGRIQQRAPAAYNNRRQLLAIYELILAM